MGFSACIEVRCRYRWPRSAIAGRARRWNSCWSNTNGGNKWTFPKALRKRASRTASPPAEAAEEAGAIGTIEPRHFISTFISKGVFWQPEALQEFVVKAFLMENHQMHRPDEANRHPTCSVRKKLKLRLAKGARSNTAHELESVIGRALERIHLTAHCGKHPGKSRFLGPTAQS